MKKLMNYALGLMLLTGCGNYEEFKEDPSSGITKLAPGQELSFAVVKAQVLDPRCVTCHSKYGS